MTLQAQPCPQLQTPQLFTTRRCSLCSGSSRPSDQRGGLQMASVRPEKSKRAKPAPAAPTDGISKGAHGLALDSVKREKKNPIGRL